MNYLGEILEGQLPIISNDLLINEIPIPETQDSDTILEIQDINTIPEMNKNDKDQVEEKKPVKEELKNILRNLNSENNIFCFSKKFEISFTFFLNKLKYIKLNLVDVNYLENGLIKHLADWSIEIKSKIKIDNFETNDLDLIFQTKFFKIFGKFDLILPKIDRFSDIFNDSPIGMTFIQIYNKIETITLLNFLSEKKIEEKMKNLLFYVGMRVKKGPEILMLKHIFEKNGLNKNLIKKSIAHQPTEQKKLITKIFFS